MSNPTSRNRLDDEKSPYLRQHADNPVNWQPWDDRALAAARDHDVPIFLSTGYSTCHWCHVMAEESFSDDAVAAILNESFVPIKVDREERPDVDTIYMTASQLVRGGGGWPLSVWLTPEGKPFHVGSYFPKRSKRGMPGFIDVLEDIERAWVAERADIEDRADRWTEAIRKQLDSPADGDSPPSDGEGPTGAMALDSDVGSSQDGISYEAVDWVTETAKAAMRTADKRNGGFGGEPKFPQPSRLHVLARSVAKTGSERNRDQFVRTLDAMAHGGLYDHLGGGFHRYCVDREWTVPHFEKMLYDNAELARAYLVGFQLTGEDRYASVAAETLAFVRRELTHPDGGIYSALDAQSETPDGESAEGAFYVWTPEAVDAALDDEDASLVCDRFGITEGGNFEGETVLNVESTIAELADAYDLSAAAVGDRLDAAKEALFEAREDRPRPHRDEKVLAAWNGMLISATAEAAIVLGGDEHESMATDALGFVREHLWTPAEDRSDGETVGHLARRYKAGDVAVDGFLDDYAFVARAGFDTYQATGDVDHLEFAIELGRSIVADFFDEDDRRIYYTATGGESLVARPTELMDGAIPSAAGVAVETLLALDAFAMDPFGDVAETVLETHASSIEEAPIEHASLAMAMDRMVTGPTEVTVAAESVPAEWYRRIGERYLPDRIISRRPPTDASLDDWLDRLGIADPPAIWAGRTAVDAETPTLYVCQERRCSPPTTAVEDALAWLDADTDDFEG